MRQDGKKLYPSEGYSAITNGEIVTDFVVLGANDSADNWHDTNESQTVPEQEIAQPTSEERLEAQVVYTAMMTDTLLEG